MKFSNLRTKIVFGSLPILLLGGSALYIAASLFITPGFQKIENESSIRNAARGVDALSNSVEQLNLKVSDWASWDDTYRFAKDQNKQYIISNLDNEALGNLQIDYMLFFNAKHQLIYVKHVDTDDPSLPSLPLDQGVKDLFKPDSQLLQHSTISDVHKGVVRTPDGLIVLVSRPILNTQGEGPINGSIVFGRYLDAADQQGLADLTHLNLTYLDATDASVAQSVPDYPSKTSKGKEWVSVISDSKSRAFATIPDIFGKPTVAVRVELDRTVTQQGRDSMRAFLVASLLIGLSIIFTTATVLNWLVVKRILGLSKQMQNIKDAEDSTQVIAVSGDDELTRLGVAINDLLVRLHNTYGLQKTNTTLEEKVKERTKELDEQLDQMKRTNELMIDREIKMKELKQQNAKLLAENGDDSP